MATERVLVVDDDAAILTLCHRILEADGYEVVDAKRGEDALAKLEAETFDLLLTDIRLPGLNGLEVTQRLRERGIELTVVTMTGYSNMEMAIQALSLGVDEFIVKPFTPESLRVHVARALEKTRLRRENTRSRTLLPLLETAQAFGAGRTRDQVYAELFDAVGKTCNAKDMLFLAVHRESDLFVVAATRGERMSEFNDLMVDEAEWNQAHSFLTEGLQQWDEAAQHRLPFGKDLAWMVSLPLAARETVLGILFFAVTTTPSQSDLEALHLIAAQASVALENVDLLGEISRAYVNVREVEQVKSEFINIAAHELRTPLAVIRGYASILHERLDEEPREYADQILQCADRLQRIADDMLNLKYLETGQVDLRLERLDVDEVIREVVNSYRPLALEREQSIELTVDRAAGDITADRAMLDLMLGSLISNAIKFSPRKSRVRVSAQGDAENVTLMVQDQGKGLTPDQVEHVFEAFYQVGSSLTRQEGGLGLGLTLTRKMVRAHGGEIWIESDSKHGSSFYISLPRNAVNSGAPAHEFQVKANAAS